MDDPSASDCSWKKMVKAKSNDEIWSTAIKFGLAYSSSSNMNSTDLPIDVDPYHFTIKKEKVDSVENSSDEGSVADQSDPLEKTDLLLTPANRKRRISVGPKNETPEERAVRLAKMSAYAAKRLAKESPEQRSQRLKRMSEYAAKRLAQESSEQRATRLARMSAYAAKRLASESPEQRRLRLTRMSAYAARRQAMKKDLASPASPNNMNKDAAATSDYVIVYSGKHNQS